MILVSTQTGVLQGSSSIAYGAGSRSVRGTPLMSCLNTNLDDSIVAKVILKSRFSHSHPSAVRLVTGDIF